MTEPRDMSEPVTRQELHDSLGIWGGALRSEIADLGTQLRTEMADLRTEMAELRTELRTDFARWATTILETVRAEIRAVFEPHDRVPARVAKLEALEPRVDRLEAHVFAPKRAKRARPKRASRRR